MEEKLHLPASWHFVHSRLAFRAYHGDFVLWALRVRAAAGPSWSAGLSQKNYDVLVRISGAETRTKAIAAVEAAAVAGGWMLPRKEQG